MEIPFYPDGDDLVDHRDFAADARVFLARAEADIARAQALMVADVIGLFVWLGSITRIPAPAPYLSCLQCGSYARRAVGSARFCNSVCSGRWWSERARLATVGRVG